MSPNVDTLDADEFTAHSDSAPDESVAYSDSETDDPDALIFKVQEEARKSARLRSTAFLTQAVLNPSVFTDQERVLLVQNSELNRRWKRVQAQVAHPSLAQLLLGRLGKVDQADREWIERHLPPMQGTDSSAHAPCTVCKTTLESGLARYIETLAIQKRDNETMLREWFRDRIDGLVFNSSAVALRYSLAPSGSGFKTSQQTLHFSMAIPDEQIVVTVREGASSPTSLSVVASSPADYDGHRLIIYLERIYRDGQEFLEPTEDPIEDMRGTVRLKKINSNLCQGSLNWKVKGVYLKGIRDGLLAVRFARSSEPIEEKPVNS